MLQFSDLNFKDIFKLKILKSKDFQFDFERLKFKYQSWQVFKKIEICDKAWTPILVYDFEKQKVIYFFEKIAWIERFEF